MKWKFCSQKSRKRERFEFCKSEFTCSWASQQFSSTKKVLGLWPKNRWQKEEKKRLAKTRRHYFCLKAVGCQFDSVRALPFSQNTFLPLFSLCCEPCFSKQCRLMKVKILINVYHPLRTTWQRWQGPHSPPAIPPHRTTAGHLPAVQLGSRKMPIANPPAAGNLQITRHAVLSGSRCLGENRSAGKTL